MEYINVKKRNILKFGIKDENGNEKVDENGQPICLEFDLEDIELPLKYNKCEFLVRKAQEDLKWKFIIIDRKQDVNDKKMLLSKNEEEKVKAVKQYYKDMEDAINLFLGDNGVQKLFGDTRYYEMFDDLAEMLEPVLPKLKVNVDEINEKIKNKYKEKEKDVLKNE